MDSRVSADSERAQGLGSRFRSQVTVEVTSRMDSRVSAYSERVQGLGSRFRSASYGLGYLKNGQSSLARF